MNEMPTIRVLQFKTEYRADKAIDMVEYAPVTAIQTSRVWARIAHIKPPERLNNDDDGKKMEFMQHRWAMIEPAYKAWKDGQEIPVNGTPIGAWPAITQDQAQILGRMGYRTIEEVASMPSSAIAKLPLPNARELPEQARLFLDGTDRAQAAQDRADRDARIAALEEQLAAAMELLEETTKGKAKPKAGKDAA